MSQQFKNKKFIFISILLFLIIGAFLFWNYSAKTTSAEGENWLTGWGNRKPITITQPIKTGTIYGNTTLGSTTSKFGTSAYFDGNGDYITLPDSDDYAFGTGDFTIDFWMKRGAVSNAEEGILGQHIASGNGNPRNIIALQADNTIWMYDSSYSGSLLTTQTVADTNWHHVAYVRSSGTLYVYIDGVQCGSKAWANSGDNPNLMYIGYTRDSYGNAAYFKGNLDELRISKGIARWTSNFTPSTLAYVADSYDTLLLHFDEATGAAAVYSGAKLGTAYSVNSSPVFGSTGKINGALSLDGTDDYISVPNSSDWDFDGDFTIDFWVNSASISTYQFPLSHRNYSTWDGAWHFYIENSKFVFSASDNSGTAIITLNDTTTRSSNTWYHVAIVRSGVTAKMYVDGNLGATDSAASGTISDDDSVLDIGYIKNYGAYLNGKIDELRISKGIARWTANFTPQTTPYTPDSYDVLLMHMDSVAGPYNNASNLLTNYQVKITVPYVTGMNSDFSDLRFTSSNGSTQLDYWIESYTASNSAIVWVELPIIYDSARVFMYYNNTGATSVSSGENTFPLFDDFSGTLSDWTTAGGTVAITSGRIGLSSTTAAINAIFKSNTKFPFSSNNGYAVKFKSWQGVVGNKGYDVFCGFFDCLDSNSSDACSANTAFGSIASYNQIGYAPSNSYDFMSHYPYIGVTGYTQNTLTQSTDFTVALAQSSGKMWYPNDTAFNSSTSSSIIPSGSLMAGCSNYDGASYSGTVSFDAIFVRKYSPYETVFSIGAQQSGDVSLSSVSISTSNSNICSIDSASGKTVCRSGQPITFTSVASDNSNNLKLYVCRDLSCTNCGLSSTTNCWAYSSSYSTSNPSAVYDSSCYASSCGTGECEYSIGNKYWAKACSSSLCSNIIAFDYIPYVSTCVSGGGLTCAESSVGTNDAVYQYTLSGTTTGTTTMAVPNGVSQIEYLIVAGGGSGGGEKGGGGGAGGYRTNYGLTKLAVSGNVTITVGAGGASVASGVAGLKGADSSIVNGSTTITSTGGGGGNQGGGGTCTVKDGGSGGGGGWNTLTGGAGNTPAVTPVQGYDGGTASGAGYYCAGGGGGAGGAGASAVTTTAGAGGVGLSNSITGTATYYAGGGGGGSYSGTGGAGGNGGGGAGGNGSTKTVGTAATANTGGGGGGGGELMASGAGGSGIVIVRFTKP